MSNKKLPEFSINDVKFTDNDCKYIKNKIIERYEKSCPGKQFNVIYKKVKNCQKQYVVLYHRIWSTPLLRCLKLILIIQINSIQKVLYLVFHKGIKNSQVNNNQGEQYKLAQI